MTSTASAGYKAQFWQTGGASISMTNEAMTDSGDHQTYNDGTSAYQCWDNTFAFVVQTSPDGVTWTTASASTYKINYAIGQVVFNSANSAGTQVRVSSGKYFTSAFVAGCKEWDGTATMSPLDSTAQQNPASPWKTFVAGLLSVQLKLAKWWMDGTLFNAVGGSNSPIIVLLYTGVNANQRFQGYAFPTKDDIKEAVNTLVDESVDWTLTGQFFFIPS